MYHQDQLTLSLMSVCLIQQNNTLDGMGAQLVSLTERIALVGDRHQHTDNHLTNQSQALESLGTKLLDLTERVVTVGNHQQQQNLVLSMVAIYLAQQREELRHLSDMVHELSERMDSNGERLWRRDRALVTDASTKRVATISRPTNAYRPSGKKLSARKRARAMA